MDIAEDLRRTALQEERLQFGAFDAETAWALGTELKRAGEAREAKIVVDIRLTTMELLSFALPGAAPDNFDWVRRKRNVVFHFHRSSYAVGLELERDKTSLEAGPWALPARDYAAHGGSFPIFIRGTGVIGAVSVSGLPKREDHAMVVEALSKILGVDIADARLD